MATPLTFGSTLQKAQTPSYNASTLFDQLPADVTKALIEIQTYINGNIKTSDQIAALPTPQKKSFTEEVELLESKLSTVRINIAQQSNAADEMKERVQHSLKNVEVVVSIYRELNASKSTRYWEVDSPCPMMWDLLKEYERSIIQIRHILDNLEQSVGSGQSQPFSPQSLKNVLLDYQHLILAATSQVQQINDIVEGLEKRYLAFRKKYYDDSTNPFKELLATMNEPLFKSRKLQSQVVMDKPPPQQGTTTGSAFSFGTSTTSTTQGFSFGGTTQSAASTSFSFGNSPTKTAGPSFSFGPASTTPVVATSGSTPSVTFGTSAVASGTTTTTTTGGTTPSFSFGAGTATTKGTTTTATTTTGTTTATTQPQLSFGQNFVKPTGTTTGTTTTGTSGTGTPSFSFGAKPTGTTTGTTTQPTFSFGQNTQGGATGGGTTPTFSFGTK